MSAELYQTWPKLCWIICMNLLIVPGTILWCAVQAPSKSRQPFWYYVTAGLLIAAILLGSFLGNSNFVANVQPFKAASDLYSYTDVDPSTYKAGSVYLDAGSIDFVENVKVETALGAGFKAGDTYCVAPIVKEGVDMEVYDFWAVAKNCCAAHAEGLNREVKNRQFDCEAWQSVTAHSGVRMVRQDLQEYFRFAIDTAKSMHGLTTQKPMALIWTEAPEVTQAAVRQAGYSFFLLSSLGFFTFSAASLVGAVYIAITSAHKRMDLTL